MRWAWWLLILGCALNSAQAADVVRGKLVQQEGRPPSAGSVSLDGEAPSMAVLTDSRLNGVDIELHGKRTAQDRFTVGPFYTSQSIVVHKNGKRYTISYWCPVCSIRTYTPGRCMCCQQETELDLQELTQ